VTRYADCTPAEYASQIAASRDLAATKARRGLTIEVVQISGHSNRWRSVAGHDLEPVPDEIETVAA